MDETGKLLETAAGMIKYLGWTQRAPRGRRGELCAYVALRLARQRTGAPYAVLRSALERFTALTGEPDMVVWNDRPGMWATEVIATLQAAANYQR
jgi:hypothetical protein